MNPYCIYTFRYNSTKHKINCPSKVIFTAYLVLPLYISHQIVIQISLSLVGIFSIQHIGAATKSVLIILNRGSCCMSDPSRYSQASFGSLSVQTLFPNSVSLLLHRVWSGRSCYRSFFGANVLVFWQGRCLPHELQRLCRYVTRGDLQIMTGTQSNVFSSNVECLIIYSFYIDGAYGAT